MINEYAEDLHAELGYRTVGQREVSQREWYSLRGDIGEAAPSPQAFKAMAKRLEKLRSRRRRPDVYRAAALRYYEAHKATLDAAAKAYRLAHKAEAAKRSRAWYLANRATVLSRQKERYQARKVAQ